MQPLHPDLRKALKDAHPGLTDEQIDESEALLSARMTLDPERDQDKIEALDRRRIEMGKTLMPRGAEVAQAFHAARRRQKRAEPSVTVVRKRKR